MSNKSTPPAVEPEPAAIGEDEAVLHCVVDKRLAEAVQAEAREFGVTIGQRVAHYLRIGLSRQPADA